MAPKKVPLPLNRTAALVNSRPPNSTRPVVHFKSRPIAPNNPFRAAFVLLNRNLPSGGLKLGLARTRRGCMAVHSAEVSSIRASQTFVGW